jgi:hypothetical protein
MKTSNHGRWLAPALAMATGWCILAQETPPADQGASAAPPPSAPPLRSAADLQKLAEPIALYPDPLISIVLPAAVYPVEIVAAARFVRDTNNIPKIDDQPWDQNVKSVAKFPDVIAMMDANLSWTVDLGQAFVDQQKDLMDAIQALRALAQKAGTLQTTPQQIVCVTNVVVMQTNVTQVVPVTQEIIQIIPASPQVVYVPVYPPTVYYPPPGYAYNPWAPLVTFGVGVAVGAIIANNCNWYRGGIYVGHHGAFVWGGSGYNRNVNVNINNFNSYNRNVNINNSRNVNVNNVQQWQPDQNRMRASGAGTTSASTREARGWSSGAGQPSTGNVGVQPSTGAVGTRPSTGTAGTRPSTGTTTGNWPGGSQAANRPAPSTSTLQNNSSTSTSGPSSSNSAFSGVSNGSSAKNYSSRGSSSLSGSSYSSGSRGGGGGRGGGRR